MEERIDNRKPEPRVLLSETKIRDKVLELASRINRDYAGQEIVAICTLKGCFMFFSDVIRHLEIPITCEFLAVSSYGNEKVSSGEVKITLDINDPLEDKHVILFEDIVDSGLTMNYLLTALKARRPASLKSCALLLKPQKLACDLEIDYVGFTIGDDFVVGYGLDYAEKFRSLPYIGCLENEH